MLIAAAVCPHPPLLVPEATGVPEATSGPEATSVPNASRGPGATGGPGATDAELRQLRAACRQAVAAVLAEHPDLIAVAGADPKTGRATVYPPEAPGSLRDYGVPFTLGEDNSAPSLPLSLTIGKWLLSGLRVPPAVWWGIAAAAPPAECIQLGERLAALAPRVALLAMGDGPARRARGAPHAADPEADRYDDQVAGALATADAAALAALDPGCDRPLEVAGRPAWQVLAGAAGEHAFIAEMHYRGVPFEVSYLVASWRRAHLQAWAPTSSPWSGRPPPANLPWPSRWPGRWTARS
jgi:hypothetical protein